MSDENRPHQHDEDHDEVEAHSGHHGNKLAANAEAGDEATGGDEVEAHSGHHGNKLAANAEAGDETDGDDDEVEAHRHTSKMADKLD